MKSILELISKYKSDVIIIPILAVLALVLSFSIYYFFTKRWIKYMPGLVTLVIGVSLLLVGYLNLLNPSGLNFIGLGISFTVFALLSLAFSAIIDLLDGLGANFKKTGKKTKKKENKKKEDFEVQSGQGENKEEISQDKLEDKQVEIEEKVKKIEELDEKATRRVDLGNKKERQDKTKRIDLKELRRK